MSPKKITTTKITDAQKQEIIDLYRQGSATTASLAAQFGVSSSTINRLLKSSIPPAEYELLVQQKRGYRGTIEEEVEAVVEPIAIESPAEPPVPEEINYGTTTVASESKVRNSRKRRSSAPPEQISLPLEPSDPVVSPLPIVVEAEPDLEPADEPVEDVSAVAEMFGEELLADDLFDDDEDEDEDEDDAIEIVGDEADRLVTVDGMSIEVLPLSAAVLPRTCYIAVDKFGELVIRPLKDFAELGQIPHAEVQQRTLPIFDNQRVAKRFANHRSQKTIKIPDSQVFYKTASHLKSKGITRLLIDGRIYSIDEY
jgi:transposase-like protein